MVPAHQASVEFLPAEAYQLQERVVGIGDPAIGGKESDVDEAALVDAPEAFLALAQRFLGCAELALLLKPLQSPAPTWRSQFGP